MIKKEDRKTIDQIKEEYSIENSDALWFLIREADFFCRRTENSEIRSVNTYTAFRNILRLLKKPYIREHVQLLRRCSCYGEGKCIACAGLFTCEVCGASEGELTTHCPGITLPAEVKELVENLKMDFVFGQWVVRP